MERSVVSEHPWTCGTSGQMPRIAVMKLPAGEKAIPEEMVQHKQAEARYASLQTPRRVAPTRLDHLLPPNSAQR